MAHRSYKKYGQNKHIGSLKPPYTEFNPHTHESPVMRNENILITSIDPGIVNCGVYTSSYNTQEKTHQSIYLERLVFNGGENHFIESMNKLDDLERKTKMFSSSHYIVIESQMTVSYDNTRLAQHLISYLMTSMKNLGNRPIIIEITSQAKTKLLECPKGLKKYYYKKWCCDKALEYLKSRENTKEESFIQKIESSKKKDDMGDAICQYYAWLKIMQGEYNRPTMPVKRY